MNRLVYDSNFLVALIDDKDKWNQKSVRIHERIKKRGDKVIYLDCVANEVINVLGRRCEEKGQSKEFGTILNQFKTLIPGEWITWIYPGIKRIYPDILNLIAASDGKLNFHDALIALYVRGKRIKYIVSFDDDFDQVKWLKRIKEETDLP